MLELRPYQRAAIDSLYSYWANGGGNGLLVLPTGAGKALVIAKIIEELLRDYRDMRIVNVTHSATLVGQNYKEFLGLMPFAPAGVYSAGLGRRDAHAQVLFCGIQSVANKVQQLGAIDLVMVDEAHAISRNSDTLYGKFFADFRARNPDGRTCGLTATDYRMDSGRLTEGDDKLFDDVVYEIGISDLINQGYLTRLTSQKTTAKIDLKGVGTRGGDYIPGQLSDAAERIIEEAIAEDMVSSAGRRAGLFFCAGKANAIHVRDAIRRHGRTCEALTSDNSEEAERIFAAFRAGELWSIASVNMIYTGANFPFVDFISLLFSTKSPGKLVQALGRGTRNSPGKTECLVADHGKNLAYHGPIDQIRPRAPGSGDGEIPKKLCPQDATDIEGKTGCGELIHISQMTCHCCGYIFPPSEEEKITATAAEAPVLSTEAPRWKEVNERIFRYHEAKEGKIDSVKVAYQCGTLVVNEWYCPQHPPGYAKNKANQYWWSHGGQRPFPATVLEWLERQGELLTTESISIVPNGRYWSVKSHQAGATRATNDNVRPAENDNDKPSWMEELDDDIPF
jgi:DNA repair protein RadD